MLKKDKLELPKVSFEVMPPPVADKDISNTITADVVVVGGGTSGMFAALSAAELGAKTILLEKGVKGYTGPHNMAAINSSLQKKLGQHVDRDLIVAELCRYASYKVDQRLINLWADKSGEVIDWFSSIVEANGMEMMLEWDVKEGFFSSFPVSHTAVIPGGKNTTSGKAQRDNSGDPSGSRYYLPILVKRAKTLGVDLRFKTPMVQLIREGKGRATGCIARDPDGRYIRFYAKKGIILCSGGYGRNVEMIEKFAPHALSTSINAAPVTNTGDGIRAALWIGAAMDPLYHEMMIFDRGLIKVGDEKKLGPPWKSGHYLWIGSQPFLRVNLHGERFVNEDLPYDFGWHAAYMQPGKVWWEVWDSNYVECISRFHTTGCARIITAKGAPPRAGIQVVIDAVNNYVEKGLIQKADSIEALAQKMKVPVDTFKATVKRYNEMWKKGKDTDFGKIPFRLSALDKAPFYAGLIGGCILCNLNGLRINTKLQVLDVDLNPIPGLYAAGNDSGSFFANNYPSLQCGMALGRAATFGRLAGLNAAAETIL